MRLYYLDKYMKFETEKLNFKQLPIEKIVLNSKIFFKSIKSRRSVRSFNKKKIEFYF